MTIFNNNFEKIDKEKKIYTFVTEILTKLAITVLQILLNLLKISYFEIFHQSYFSVCDFRFNMNQ